MTINLKTIKETLEQSKKIVADLSKDDAFIPGSVIINQGDDIDLEGCSQDIADIYYAFPKLSAEEAFDKKYN